MSEYVVDYSYCNQAFVDGLTAFLEYTDPDPLRRKTNNDLVVRRCLQKKDFEKRCIQRWAISELIEAILDDQYNPVEDIAYRFALKLCRFECNSTDEKMRSIFHIAEDFIEKEVIGLFKEREGVYP